MVSNYISKAERILKENGPCLSSRLCELLKAEGLSAEAARQQISRVRGKVKRLQGLTFSRGVSFYYHTSSFGSPDYWQTLLKTLHEAGPAYATAVAALQARGGIVPRQHFDIICGSPLRQKRQISSEMVLQRLEAIDLLKLVDIQGIGPCVSLSANGYFGAVSVPAMKARLLTEGILLLAVKEWARKLGIASYDKITVRDDIDEPRIGTFKWDLAGPSYLRPIVQFQASGKPHPGFLVCDAIAGHSVNEGAIAAFIRKCRLTQALRRIPPILPILIADNFTREALRLGRSEGIIMATPETLFGREVARGLASLLQTMAQAAAVAIKRPEVIDELFNSLGQIEGAAKNLRGALFEVLVGHCVFKNEDGLIDIGKVVTDPDTGKKAEIDVFRVKEHREVWAYECKAHQPTELIDLDAIKKWLEVKVPLIHKSLSSEPRFIDGAFHYEFWTCGSFTPEAFGFLESAEKKIKRYQIGWKRGDEVRKYVARVKPNAVLKMLDEHYFSHPIARINRKYDAESALADVELNLDLGDFLEEAPKSLPLKKGATKPKI